MRIHVRRCLFLKNSILIYQPLKNWGWNLVEILKRWVPFFVTFLGWCFVTRTQKLSDQPNDRGRWGCNPSDELSTKGRLFAVYIRDEILPMLYLGELFGFFHKFHWFRILEPEPINISWFMSCLFVFFAVALDILWRKIFGSPLLLAEILRASGVSGDEPATSGSWRFLGEGEFWGFRHRKWNKMEHERWYSDTLPEI